MMHSINQEGELVKVNRRWLTTLGYAKDEVMGRKSVDFLTDDSRVQVVTDALPLFWRVGSARTIGLRFDRKDGRIFDGILDAEAVTSGDGVGTARATIRPRGDRTNWQEASSTLTALQKLDRIRDLIESLLASGNAGDQERGLTIREELRGRELPELIEAAHEVSEILRQQVRDHGRRLDALLNRQAELVLLADSIEISIAQLTGGEERIFEQG